MCEWKRGHLNVKTRLKFGALHIAIIFQANTNKNIQMSYKQ